jgi:AmiR/NasT family two-component response regulator
VSNTPDPDGSERLDHALQAKIEQLETAVESRHAIGITQGMVMLRYGLTEEQSLEYLKRISMADNIKLRDVAKQVKEDLRATPWPENG